MQLNMNIYKRDMVNIWYYLTDDVEVTSQTASSNNDKKRSRDDEKDDETNQGCSKKLKVDNRIKKGMFHFGV